MHWRWLFDLETWLLRREGSLWNPYRRQRWRTLRKPVSALTRRLERRGRMVL